MGSDADMDKSNVLEETPMGVVAKHGHEDIACCLVEAGADMDKADNARATAMHFAVMGGYKDIVRLGKPATRTRPTAADLLCTVLPQMATTSCAALWRPTATEPLVHWPTATEPLVHFAWMLGLELVAN